MLFLKKNGNGVWKSLEFYMEKYRVLPVKVQSFTHKSAEFST